MSTPSMPAMESSSGLVTCDSMTSDEAPTSLVVTVTTGSSMRGYSRTASRSKDTSADEHDHQRHHGREDRAADRGLGDAHGGLRLRATAHAAPTRRWPACCRPARPRPHRRRGREMSTTRSGTGSPRPSRACPAVTTRSPAARPSSTSTLPGRRSPMRASMRWDTLPFGPVDHLEDVLLAALRHQRLLGHDQRVLALREDDARAREQARLEHAARVVEPRAHQQRAAVGVDHRVERIDAAGEALARQRVQAHLHRLAGLDAAR